MDEIISCKICGRAASGKADYWQCEASQYHFWRWKVNQIRTAKKQWQPTKYQAEVINAFKSSKERSKFLAQHVLTYGAQS